MEVGKYYKHENGIDVVLRPLKIEGLPNGNLLVECQWFRLPFDVAGMLYLTNDVVTIQEEDRSKWNEYPEQ